MSNKWMKQLQKLEGAVKRDYDPYQNVIRTKSPSINFIFGNTHGLPLGYSMVVYGPPKGGKSLLANAFVGQLHSDDPEAIAIKYNTEMREEGQLTPHQMKVWGIDEDRYMAYNTNQPHEIFDAIEKDVNAMCQEGAPVRLIIIDSVNGIAGRRALNADTIMTQQIGDDAKTVGDGLKRILPVIRRNKIALIMTSQIRAEMDQREQMRGKTIKMAAAWQLKHYAEYFVFLEPNQTKEGRTDLLGNEFIDANVKDFMDKGERMGHKIRVTMQDSSCGPKGRVAEFTLDYSQGIVNVQEEVFKLATRRGVVPLVGKSYIVKDFPAAGEEQRYVGKADFLNAIRDNEYLTKELITRVRRIDIDAMRNGRVSHEGAANMTDEESASTSEE
jgi:RecA/RadA recombinase